MCSRLDSQRFHAGLRKVVRTLCFVQIHPTPDAKVLDLHVTFLCHSIKGSSLERRYQGNALSTARRACAVAANTLWCLVLTRPTPRLLPDRRQRRQLSSASGQKALHGSPHLAMKSAHVLTPGIISKRTRPATSRHTLSLLAADGPENATGKLRRKRDRCMTVRPVVSTAISA